MINRRLKNIIVPKDEISMNLLFENRMAEFSNYEFLSMDKEDLELVFKSGLFDVINNKMSIIIDDYEEEEIIGIEKLIYLKEIVYNFSIENPIVIYYKESILKLIEDAIYFKTGIFFYF